MLYIIISSSKEAKRVVDGFLTTTTPSPPNSEEDENTNEDAVHRNEQVAGPTGERGVKRGRSGTVTDEHRPAVRRKRFEHCAQCGEEYDVTCNGGEECCLHPGEQEMVEDFWCDSDMSYDEIMAVKDDWLKGFMFSCCRKLGDEEGCEIGRHQPL